MLGRDRVARAEPERGRAQGARAILFDELTVEEPRARAGADARHLDEEENAYFEAQLAVVDEGSPQRFATIAAGLPDKSEDDVQAWYEKLLGDLLEIEAGARAWRLVGPSPVVIAIEQAPRRWRGGDAS